LLPNATHSNLGHISEKLFEYPAVNSYRFLKKLASWRADFFHDQSTLELNSWDYNCNQVADIYTLGVHILGLSGGFEV